MMVALLVPAILVTLLGICYWFIPVGTGERSGFLSTIILTEVMFLVMLTTYLPVAKRLPYLGLLFLFYVAILVIMSCLVLVLEDKMKKLRERLAEIDAENLEKKR
jgi:hypothetical protein